MSLQTRLEALITAIGADIKVLQSRGLPTGGSTNDVLTKSSATNYAAAWLPPTPRLFRTGHTWLVAGTIASGTLPPIFIPEASTVQTTSLVAVRAQILSGASVTVQMQRNGVNLGSVIPVTPTPSSTSFAQAITDLDRLGIVLSNPSSSPADLSVTAILEHVV